MTYRDFVVSKKSVTIMQNIIINVFMGAFYLFVYVCELCTYIFVYTLGSQSNRV